MSAKAAPELFITYTTELMRIAHAGWGIGVHPTPFGVFYRLEKGPFHRGGPLRGWWRSRSLSKAIAHLVREAAAHPRFFRTEGIRLTEVG